MPLHVDDATYIDELILYIEDRLNALSTHKQKVAATASDTPPPTLDSSIKYGSNLLENVREALKTHFSKKSFMSDLSGVTQKVVRDALKGTAQTHWMVAGLSVVAYVSDQIDPVSSNKKECVQLLRYMCELGKHMKHLGNHDLPHEKVNQVFMFIVEGSYLCVSPMQSSKLSRFFSVAVDAEDLQSLQAQLGHVYPDLTFESLKAMSRQIPTLPPPGLNPDAADLDRPGDDRKLFTDDKKSLNLALNETQIFLQKCEDRAIILHEPEWCWKM